MTQEISGTKTNWTEIVGRINSGDPSGCATLYVSLKPLRSVFARQIGRQYSEDLFQELVCTLIDQIKRGQLRQPAALQGYAYTVAGRMVARERKDLFHARRNYNAEERFDLKAVGLDPEESAIKREQLRIAGAILQDLGQRNRDILTRFYLYHQTPGQICHDMNLTETQFRILKSRAKALFAERCQQAQSTRKTA